MGSAAIFDKVQLRSQADLTKLDDLLHSALREYLNEHGPAPDMAKNVERISLDVLKQLKQFITSSDDVGDEVTPGSARSPTLPPLSPLPVDDEVLQLEKEVAAASERVNALRSSMATKISDALISKLERYRPSSEPSEDRDGAEANGTNDDDEEEEPAKLSEDKTAILASLEPRLRQQLARLPEIRAQLEQADAECKLLLQTIEEEEARPAPNTVERALYNLDDDPEPSEAAAAAVRAGAVSTRRGRSESRPDPVQLNDLYDEKEAE